MNLLSSPEARLALSLALGLLIGTERERRRDESVGFAGVRTFALVGLLGGLFAITRSQALVVLGAGVVGLSAIAAYVVNRSEPDRGMTTELALVVTYGLGVLAIEQPAIAAAASVGVASLLALRSGLHRFVRETLTNEEARDGLLFLLFALVVLPVAPDVRIGPYGAINPQSLTRLIVVLMLLTAIAHMAQRLIGARLGLALTGFLGGFVSSSATIGAMSVRARELPTRWRSAAAGGLASNVATVAQYALIIVVVDLSLVMALAPLLAGALAASLLVAGAFVYMSDGEERTAPSMGRPFRLWAALGFALVFSIVSIGASALQQYAGSSGIVTVSAVAALLDAHSSAASVASLHRQGSLDVATAELCILASLSANSVTKIVLAWTGRHLKYGLSVTAGVLFIAGAAWLCAALT